MSNVSHRRSLRSVLVATCLLLSVTQTGRATPDPQPLIIAFMSESTPPYEEALVGLRQGIGARRETVRIDVRTLPTDRAEVETLIRGAAAERPDLVVTLGTVATRAAAAVISDRPIVAGMVLDDALLQSAPNLTGVALTFPIELQIESLRRFLPDSRRLGVLYHPRHNGEFVRRAEKLAREAGFRLVLREVDAPGDLPDALKSLERSVDAIWGIPDPVVLSPDTARTILLFTIRNRIPFVGLSKAWVDAGALYALDRDYGDLGEQCAEMALRILAGTRSGSLPPTGPRRALYSVNLKTAHHLGLDLPGSMIRDAAYVVE